MMTSDPFPRERDLSFGSQERWDAFFDGESVDASVVDPSLTPITYPCTPSNQIVPITSSHTPAAHLQIQSEPDKLRFLELNEWDERNSYEELVPTCLHYSIEWKVVVNNKVVVKDTEEDLVLVPIAYWHMILQPKLEKLLRRKLAQNRQVRCDDTNVVVSVSGRTERDLTKRFDDLSIDWSVVAKRLMAWGELFRSGKKLRVDLSFNYVDLQPSSAGTPKRSTKRGSSATQTMLADRAAQLDAEQNTAGNTFIWQEVYSLMRCPGSPCDLGPHCWRDPLGKKHYRLATHHLKALINFVEQGNILRTYDDIPEAIREQLYTEERQRLERQPKSNNMSTPFPPINITSVLPQSHQSPIVNSSEPTPAAEVRPFGDTCLDIPGLRDQAVKEYSEWQQSNVCDETQKADFRKACEAALEDGLDLEQVYEDQDPGFFIRKDVRRGVARRFICDIKKWVKDYKQACDSNTVN
jgi:hypothetical protein